MVDDLLNGKHQPLILLVDDVSKNLQVLGSILKECGYQLAFATSGAKALQMVDALSPDLILLDIMMPDLDGYAVCTQLKQAKETRHIPVIFLTAKTEPEELVNGFAIGAVDYIKKPFDSEELIARVKNHLELKLSRDLIQKQNRELKEMLHVLCHDLMNPIGSSISILDLVNDGKDFNEMAPLMKMALDNCVDVIGQVRKFRALEDKEKALNLELLELSELINHSLSILDYKIQEKEIEIELNVPTDVKVLVEEVSFCNSVINNILTNAVKFSYQGSTVYVSATRRDDMLDLSIKDNGIGIPEEMLEQLFDFSANINRDGTKNERGTGFGMPLVKKYVHAYGGEIAITSKEILASPREHGTDVVITLKTTH